MDFFFFFFFLGGGGSGPPVPPLDPPMIGFEKCDWMALRRVLAIHPSMYIADTYLSIPYFNIQYVR